MQSTHEKILRQVAVWGIALIVVVPFALILYYLGTQPPTSAAKSVESVNLWEAFMWCAAAFGVAVLLFSLAEIVKVLNDRRRQGPARPSSQE